ncbi:MAG: sigma-70 family RNA polymerase sigma factor [Myxococcota bacterium]
MRSENDALTGFEPLLRAVVGRVVGRGPEADDLIQETYLRALQHQPDPSRPLGPWLARVARNLAIDAVRDRSRVEPIEDLEDLGQTEAERLPLTASELLPALGSLSDGEVVVLLLREMLDYSVEDTAAALDSTPGSVRVLHHRARTRARAVPGSLDGGLRATERFLAWLAARKLAGLPTRAELEPGDAVWTHGVLEAHRRLTSALVELTRSVGRGDLEFNAVLFRGEAHRRLRDGPAALADFRRAAELAGTALHRAYSGLAIARELARMGASAEAEAIGRGALEALGDDDTEAGRRTRVGALALLVDLVQGSRPAEAEALLAQLRLHDERTSDGPTRVMALCAEGIAAIREERYADAEIPFMAGLERARAIGYPGNEAALASNLALCAQGLGHLERARGWLEYSRPCAVRVGDRRAVLLVDSLSAVQTTLEGRVEDALMRWERVVTGWVELGGSPPEEVEARMYLGIALHLQGRLEAAERTLRSVVGQAGAEDQAAAHLAAVRAEAGRVDPEAVAAGIAACAAGSGARAAAELLATVVDRGRAEEALRAAPEWPVPVQLARRVVEAALLRSR